MMQNQEQKMDTNGKTETVHPTLILDTSNTRIEFEEILVEKFEQRPIAELKFNG